MQEEEDEEEREARLEAQSLQKQASQSLPLPGVHHMLSVQQSCMSFDLVFGSKPECGWHVSDSCLVPI